MKIIAFISDHGFGHAARSTAIIRLLLENNVSIHICSKVPLWFFRSELADLTQNWQYTQIQTDVGLFQLSGVSANYHRTINALENHWQLMPTKIKFLAKTLKNFNADAIFFDIPAIAPLLAEKLQIPAIAFGNFSWDWIYQELTQTNCSYTDELIAPNLTSQFARFAKLNAEAYAKTSQLFTLPYSSDFSAFTCQRTSIPWVGKMAKTPPSVTRNLLNLGNKKTALLTFGGNSLPNINFNNWQIPADWQILIAGHTLPENANIRQISNQQLYDLKINYTDLLAACNLVITKPGYGIISDCIFNKIPMIHVPRGRFAEYPLLLNALNENLNHKLCSIDEITQGTFLNYADSLIAKNICIPKFATNGTEIIVNNILKLLK